MKIVHIVAVVWRIWPYKRDGPLRDILNEIIHVHGVFPGWRGLI